MRERRLTEFARANRKDMPEPEVRMWLALRGKRFEAVKFRRQKVIGRYIVDFASRAPMLVIELDGNTHAGRERQDAERTRFLEEQGYKVIRYTNADVITNLEGVMTRLAGVIATAPLPTLSPEGERAK